MDRTPFEVAVLIFAVLGFIGWLGGGRKWAFRTLLSALILTAVGAGGILMYIYWTDKAAENRSQKLHECAVAKVADPKCDEPPKGSNLPKGSLECPAYIIGVDATPEQEEGALSLAEQECRGEMNPQEKSLHEQLVQYRREHGTKGPTTNNASTGKTKGDILDQVVKDCAAKVRKAYPGSYNALDDETLTKKVLAKYPKYCDVTP
jgi:hypothetical protein